MKNSNSTAIASGTIVIAALVVLVMLTFVFKGKVHF